MAVEGVGPTFLALRPAEIFWRNIRYHEFDVAEMSLSSYMLLHGKGMEDWVGLPIFPSRALRRSAIYVRAGCPWTRPEDLRGRTVVSAVARFA